MPIQNLEPLCARWGREMIDTGTDTTIDEKENTITKALGVLAENGLYATGVFLLSCHKKTYGIRVLTIYFAGLWQECGILQEETRDEGAMLSSIVEITSDLPKLILAKKVVEQAMIFARYHAKAERTSAGEHP